MTEPLGMETLGRAVEMLEIICMKPFGVKVIGMAPLRMELAKLRTAAELLERHTDLELLEPLGMEMAEIRAAAELAEPTTTQGLARLEPRTIMNSWRNECSKPWA